VNVIPESGHFEPQEKFFLSTCSTLAEPVVLRRPTMIVRLLQRSRAHAAPLKTIIYGGAPMYVADSLRAIDAVRAAPLTSSTAKGRLP